MARKKTSTSSPQKVISLKLTKQQEILLGSALAIFGLALFISFFSYLFTWQVDQSTLPSLTDRSVETKNWLNKFGAGISHFFMYKGFGIAAFILASLVTTTGVYYFFDKNKTPLKKLWLWGIFLMFWFAIALGFLHEKNSLLGGVVGFELNDFLQDYLGFIGTLLFLFFLLIIYAVIRLKVTPKKVSDKITAIKKSKTSGIETPAKTVNNKSTINSSVNQEVESRAELEPRETITAEPEVNDTTVDLTTETTPNTETKSAFEQNIENLEPTLSINNESQPDFEATVTPEEEIKVEIEQPIIEDEIEVISAKIVEDFGEFDPTLELGNFQFPPVDLLKDYTGGKGITINQEELEENKNRIVSTLNNYKIGIASIKATVGPTVTLYEIVPEAGIRISKIKNLEDDIALSLSALGIRIIAPIPGRGTIGIEVPNKNPRIVSMRSAVASPKFQEAEMQLPLTLGKTISNETFVVDLAKMPHLLMAGATGQGKSVGLNAILTSLLYKKHPAEVKFVLVDPKKVELTLFNKIERHYLAKLPDEAEAIITDNTKVINTLNSMCIEMDARYDLLKNAMCRNIAEYNAKFKARKLNPNNGHKFLPYIVLVVDEFADLIMTAGKEVETPIARLAQLARAIGIHLIIATQRPSVNVITGIIKANFPARIAFRVTSKIDSRTILDSPGADQLIGRGDMLYTQGNDLVRIQCAFVDTPEVERIVEFIGNQKAYPDAYLLPEYVGEDSGTSIDVDIADRDKLFKEAAEVIVIAQQGSASLLQRKLKLGYNRAGRIIDQLEAAGIVGPFEGSKARQVLITDLIALEQFLNEEKND